MIETKRIQEINEKIAQKIKAIERRTAKDTVQQLRLKFAMAELNWENVLDERDYLMSTEWKPIMDNFRSELHEAIRLCHRLDVLSSNRVEEILTHLLQALGERESEGERLAG